MKKIFTILTALCFIAVTGTAAQPKNREDWKQKMMNEKIAFLTTELNITPEEGQVFWPVYNKVNQEKDAAMRNVFKAYRNLAKATEEGVKGKELENVNIMDLAPTVAKLLGTQPDPEWEGKSLI